MTHLLDTSAMLAHYLGEPGLDRIVELIYDPRTSLGISALSLYEFEIRLVKEGLSSERRRNVVERYIGLFDRIVDLTPEIAAIAASLREASSSRVSAVDCLIAATALHLGATLVHRDAHFAALPLGRPAQEVLPEKS